VFEEGRAWKLVFVFFFVIYLYFWVQQGGFEL
jgi:hypothetical protein